MTREKQPLVSVVTPFYNTVEYLGECIESVLAQTYQRWEYCLVDNCSDDGSADVARRKAASDARIRVVDNTEFLTQVQNYNHALRQISPESRYTKIVQANDWMYPECLERSASQFKGPVSAARQRRWAFLWGWVERLKEAGEQSDG